MLLLPRIFASCVSICLLSNVLALAQEPDPSGDSTAPFVSCSVRTPVIFSTDHKFVDVGLQVLATDDRDSSPRMDVRVYSNEDDDETGNGNFSPDVRFVPPQLLLRAERRGNGQGRVYLIVVTATDAAGNSSRATCTVVVPLNQSSAALSQVQQMAAQAAAQNIPPPSYFANGDGPDRSNFRVTITSPMEGSSFAWGQLVSFNSTATFAPARVEYYDGFTKIGESATAPFIVGYANPGIGVHVVEAVAIDSAGTRYSSNPTTFTQRPNVAPTVQLTGPPSETVIQIGQTVLVTAEASDVDGAITKVELFANGTKVLEAAAAPFSFNWSSATPGRSMLIAVATDNAGARTLSGTIIVSVNSPPTASITSPAPSAVFQPGEMIPVSASASDSDGTVQKVEFFAGATKIGETTTPPFSFMWNPAVSGNYAITAVATDNTGATTTTSAIQVRVNAPPTIAITSPADGSEVTVGADVAITAAASDPDDGIAKVEFFAGPAKIGEAVAAPYLISWKDEVEGEAILTARAIDGSGAAVTSGPITIKAKTPVPTPTPRPSATPSPSPTCPPVVAIPTIVMLSGNDQQGIPGRFLRQPFIVRATGSAGQPAQNVPITFSVMSGGGQLTTDRFVVAPASALTVMTNSSGLVSVYYLQGPEADVVSNIVANRNDVTAQVSFTATATSAAPLTPQSVAVGTDDTLAVYADGTVWGWGGNYSGELGDGTTVSQPRRIQAANLSGIAAVSAHTYTSVALRSDGTVWSWGDNNQGLLGNGGSADSALPVQVLTAPSTPLAGVVAIASGYGHNLALKADGTVWGWGNNWAFQLGTTVGRNSLFAKQVLMPDGSALRDIVAIAAGNDHNLALSRDGTVRTWGDNEYRQLGTGSTAFAVAVPTLVPNLTDVIAIAGGATHSMALKADGTVRTWGRNSNGQLGDGLQNDTQLAPVQVVNLDHIIDIAAGDYHSLALRSDGTIWAWGSNGNGQLGIQDQVSVSLSPKQTSGLGSVIAIAGGSVQSFAVTADGSIWSWGYNGSANLGDGTTTDRRLPTSVSDFLLIEDPDHDGLPTWEELSICADPNAYSTAGDGISDGWKLFYGLSLTDADLASRDLTGKGLTVGQDFQIGTNPLKFSTVDDGIADGWKIQYQLDPFDITLATRDLTGKGYNVRTDFQLGTNPTLQSTVGDTIPDGWKVQNLLDPLDPFVANTDTEGDGLTNVEEYNAGSKPRLPDTDGDGVPDVNDGAPADPDLHPPRLPESNYAVIDLGNGAARAINNNNQVIGDNTTGFFWDKGVRQDFPQHAGADFAVAINDDGLAAFNRSSLGILWKAGTETQLGVTDDPSGKVFGLDPNITFAQAYVNGIAGITKFGSVAGTVFWAGSPFGGFVNLKAAFWGPSYIKPTFLDTTPDADDRVLVVDDGSDHGYYRDYNQTADSTRFPNGYDNSHGLDDTGGAVAINNLDQIVGYCTNYEALNSFGFPARTGFGGSSSVTLWTNLQPEIVSTNGRPHAINDDGIIAGINSLNHTVLWVKLNGQWKEKDLGAWGLGFGTSVRMNNKLQVVAGRYLYQNAHLVDLATRVPSNYTNIRALGINDLGVIVGQADIRTSPTLIQRNRAVIFVPLELKQLNYPTTAATTDMGPTKEKVIASGEVAYITGVPEMPRLEARLGNGALTGLTVEWRVDVKSERTERGTRDNFLLPGPTATNMVPVTVDQPWQLTNQYVAPREFFGGKCTLFYRVRAASGYVSDEQKFEFKIRGKNPKDADAKAYIESTQGQYRFAWAIVQHESRQDPRIYNQFNSGGATRELPNYGAPDGWGIAQLDQPLGISASTSEVYSYQTNVQKLYLELTLKRSDAERYIRWIRNRWGNDARWEEPPQSWTISSSSFTPVELATIVLYNGAAGIPLTSGIDDNGDAQSFRSPWIFDPDQPTGHRWQFRDNRNPVNGIQYATTVIIDEWQAGAPFQE